MTAAAAKSITIRIVGSEAAAAVLAAGVFDDPAGIKANERFLGPPGCPDSRNILALAWLDDKIVGFASGAVLDHPDKQRNLFLQELGV